MITIDQAKALAYGTILYHGTDRNSDGSASRWKVNGKPKTWKRTPARVAIPVKHGLWTYDTLTQDFLSDVSLTDPTKEE